MKQTIMIIGLVAVFALCAIQPALAAKSLTKSYKVSVTLPQMVGSESIQEFGKVRLITDVDWRKNLDITVIVRNNQTVELHTYVIQ